MPTEASLKRLAAAKEKRAAKKAEHMAKKAELLKPKPFKPLPVDSFTKAQKAKVIPQVLERIEVGFSLQRAIRDVEGAPPRMVWYRWLKDDPDLTRAYTDAKHRGYLAMADDLQDISDSPHIGQTKTKIIDPDGGVTVKFVEEDMLGHRNLQISTRKWLLSKLLPKIFGDKILQEVSGPDGQPVSVSSVDLRGLSEDELATMQRLLLKAASAQ